MLRLTDIHTLGGVEATNSVTDQATGQKSEQKQPRDLRLRKQYFPGAEDLVFDTKKKGFVPLPIIMRKLMRHLSAPELRVLVYLQTRCSKYFICYPTQDEIAHDLALNGPRNLTPHIKALEKKRFIATASGGGKKYYLVYHPRVPITHLVDAGEITEQELFEINEVLSDLNQELITAVPKPAAPKVVTPIRKAK